MGPLFAATVKPGTGAGCSTFLATCAPAVSGRNAASFTALGGHCKDPEHGNPGYKLKDCANTCCEICRSCPVQDRLDQCTPDGYGQCSQWASMGECDANTVWMHQHCMGSCCPNCPKGCPTTPEGCTNSYSESKCVAWARVGECDRNPGWMSQNCQKECCPTCRRAAPAPIMQPMYGGFAPQNTYAQNPYASLPYHGTRSSHIHRTNPTPTHRSLFEPTASSFDHVISAHSHASGLVLLSVEVRLFLSFSIFSQVLMNRFNKDKTLFKHQKKLCKN